MKPDLHRRRVDLQHHGRPLQARRLQAEHGLDLIIVDYLQLMTARRTENRVQEISEISRGLKGWRAS